MQVKNLVLDLFTKSVQRREALLHLSYSLESFLVFDGRGIITLPMVV